MKKGQGISVNVIVIAALALIILVILSTIVIQKLGGFNRNTEVCGRSTSAEQCRFGDCLAGESPNPSRVCLNGQGQTDQSQVCCIKGLG